MAKKNQKNVAKKNVGNQHMIAAEDKWHDLPQSVLDSVVQTDADGCPIVDESGNYVLRKGVSPITLPESIKPKIAGELIAKHNAKIGKSHVGKAKKRLADTKGAAVRAVLLQAKGKPLSLDAIVGQAIRVHQGVNNVQARAELAFCLEHELVARDGDGNYAATKRGLSAMC